MAYVAITQNLKADIGGKINEMMQAELSSCGTFDDALKQLGNDLTFQNNVMALLWKPEEDLRARLSKYSTNIRIHANIAVPDFPGESVRPEFNTKDFPCFINDNYSHGVDVPSDVDDRLVEVFEKYAVRKEVIARWEKVLGQVMAFLDKCKSLNEAVKLWPDMRTYVGKQYLSRLDEPAEKKAKEASEALAALKNMDFDSITTSTVLARMAGARV